VLPAQGYKSPPQNPRLPTGGFVKIPAFSKINLFLDVLGKRPDGYHNIVSVMQIVDLFDDISIKWNFDDLVKGCRVQLSCGAAGVLAEDNLVTKAAHALIEEYDLQGSFEIELVKRVPVGAGLGGGSSDCAATLLGINKLLGFKIPFSRLLEIGRSLGADVPFCLTGGTALVEGIGEKITPLPKMPPCFFVIAYPDIKVSTADIFARFSLSERSFNVSATVSAIMAQNLPQIASSFYNVFEPITAGLFPQIEKIITRFRAYGALGVQMSGTGSAVFACFNDEKSAFMASNRIKKYASQVFLCKPI
jgi:4-diphosphocytidyl-2-C-methyl-D-erythritol kinase